jgi:hypothetical protein
MIDVRRILFGALGAVVATGVALTSSLADAPIAQRKGDVVTFDVHGFAPNGCYKGFHDAQPGAPANAQPPPANTAAFTIAIRIEGSGCTRAMGGISRTYELAIPPSITHVKIYVTKPSFGGGIEVVSQVLYEIR